MDKNRAFVPPSDMALNKAARPLAISLLALPESTPAALYGLHEMFASVGITWEVLTGERNATPKVSVDIVSRTGAPFRSTVGAFISPTAKLDDVAAADVIITTDLSVFVDDNPTGRWSTEAAWVRQQFERGAVICSVCTGSIFLAEAGLLEGLEATTHWSACDILARHYPNIRMRPERTLLPTGPEHRVITGGGAASWEELGLYVIARFIDQAEAIRIAKIFVLGDRSSGQLPFSVMSRPRQHEDAVIARCQAWIADHYAGTNPVARMVEVSKLPERTFKRRFKSATGYTPVDYVQTLRIEEAKHLLETTNTATDDVAEAVGYGDPAFFRRLFKRRAGITPAVYRRRYQAIGALGSY